VSDSARKLGILDRHDKCVWENDISHGWITQSVPFECMRAYGWRTRRSAISIRCPHRSIWGISDVRPHV